ASWRPAMAPAWHPGTGWVTPWIQGWCSIKSRRKIAVMSQTADQRPVTIRIFPPDEESKKALQGVEGTRVTPGVVSALDGSTCAAPKMPGVLRLLHPPFAEATGAKGGYRNSPPIKATFRILQESRDCLRSKEARPR